VNKRTYTPQPGSLPARVCAFFTQQPDEELEPLDIVTKFDAIQTSVQSQLKLPVEHGLLAIRKKNIGNKITSVYCAGPKLTQGHAATAPAAAPAVEPATPIARRSIDDATSTEWTAASRQALEQMRAKPLESTATVTDITYEPLVENTTKAASGKWTKQLQAVSALPITGQGHPTQRFPRGIGRSIQKAIHTWNKHHPQNKLQARLRGDHTIVQRIA